MKIRLLPASEVVSLIKGKTDNFYLLPKFLSLFFGKSQYFLVDWNGFQIIFPVKINKLNFFSFKLNKIYCPSAPIIIDGNPSNRQKLQIIDVFEKYLSLIYNHKFISITQLPSLKPFLTLPIPPHNGWKLTPSFSRILDLSIEIKKLFSNFEKRTRYSLRKFTKCANEELISASWAEKIKYSIKISENYRDLKYFYKNRNQIKKKIILEGSEPTKYLNKSILTKNFQTLSKARFVKLFLIFDENEELGASAIIFTIKEPPIYSLAYYSAGTSSEIGRKLGLPTILQWFIINWLKKNEFQYYDLGGISSNPDHGPSRFKRGFGGKIIRGWILTKQSVFFQYLDSIIKMLKIKKLQLRARLNII